MINFTKDYTYFESFDGYYNFRSNIRESTNHLRRALLYLKSGKEYDELLFLLAKLEDIKFED